MPVIDKPTLLSVTEKEWHKLSELLNRIDARMAAIKDDDDTSIKDVVGHRAHWIDLFLGWYADGQAGKEVHFPAPGYNWSQLKAYNAALRAAQATLTWHDAQTMLSNRHDQLLRFISGLDDAQLYGGPMKGARNAWTPGRWAEASGPSHYRSAAKYIRARIKALS